MVRGRETVERSHLSLYAIDSGRDELDHLAAPSAEEMFVMRSSGARLVTLETLVEVMLANESRLAHELERAVDGRLPNRATTRAKACQDFFGRDVMVGSEKELGYPHPLRCYGMPAGA
jgi:hypothetical protein